ncbi:MAG: tRNA adenosine(34) deaminase TadA [Gammaproteobacteria bacterium]|nr:tRNA adenosine(34) deaminase TadA [Gammaproteobacteria bacterium]
MPDDADEEFMREAIRQAHVAEQHGEIPVGAVLVRDGDVVGRGATCQIEMNDPSAHAEVAALRDAARRVGNYRLVDSTLYVTLEPCMMCVGAMVHARIARLVYGCLAPKTGVIHSHANLIDWSSHNHHIEVCGGILTEDCSTLLSGFFERKRGGG